MKVITYNGKNYPCLEDIAELRSTSEGDNLFSSCFNIDEMLKQYIGKDIYINTDEDIKDVEIIADVKDSEFGKFSGRYVKCDDYDFFIEIYKPENIKPDDFDDLVAPYDADTPFWWLSNFFVEDSTGQLWVVITGAD